MARRLAMASAAAVLMAGAPALAEQDGFYLSGGVLGQHMTERDVSGGVAGGLKMDPGMGATAALGYGFGGGVRVEGELSYRHNLADKFNGGNVTGALDSLGGLVNVVWEYENDAGFHPYIGAGLGLAQVQANDINFGGGATLDDSSAELAWQGLTGIAVDLDRNLSLIAEYRYFHTGEADMRASNGASVGVNYATHTAMVGLRFRFGGSEAQAPVKASTSAPAGSGNAALSAARGPKKTAEPRRLAPPGPEKKAEPAPLPVAQAKAASSLRRTYVVFFAFDSAELQPEARGTVAEASDRAVKDGTAVIQLAGHADRSGPAAYNLELSRKRAINTAAEIRKRGVQSALEMEAYGETKPLVPTADGVAEPRNRRVEIVLKAAEGGVNVSRK